MVDRTTMLASLTPLSDDDAERADEHFGTFLEILEGALSKLA